MKINYLIPDNYFSGLVFRPIVSCFTSSSKISNMLGPSIGYLNFILF